MGPVPRGIYVDDEERDLFHKWLALPHPELGISPIIPRDKVPPYTPASEAEVSAAITEEKNWRSPR